MSSLNKKATAGFSLLELLIAMVITMALMTAASTLLANALRVRSRENQKSDALDEPSISCRAKLRMPDST
jgi:prepilin-type N-terminal cleavage/methylation domain-containing protein